MKKKSIILLAFALLAMMTQCKKENEQIIPDNTGNTVAITLSISNGNSKVDVNPSTGTVNFESGDIIYVGSGGKYVGMLTHNGAGHFVGNITNPTEGQPLYFYFLGNVTPQETLGPGSTEECSVVISDQTQHLPVISCAPSNEEYAPATTSYTAKLKNKCALVKFNVTTPSNSPICITGMHNKVTVDFANNTLTPSQDGEGVIMLPAGNGENVEKWAILLPQEELEEGEEGTAYSEDGLYIGARPDIPAIVDNGYIAMGIVVVANTQAAIEYPIGAINGLFTINEEGGHVCFSKGNLQYWGSASTPYWRFADNQWDYLGNNGQGSSYQTVDRDLFGWGTSGYNHGATCYQPWSTSGSYSDYYAYGDYHNNLFDQTGQADWGYNAIGNGGNIENSGWRTLTVDEWNCLFNTRPTNSGIRYAKGIVNNVKGVILLPNNWSVSNYELNYVNNGGVLFSDNIITAEDWTNNLEANGAVFLPAAGTRGGTSLSNIGEEGRYWSSSGTFEGGQTAGVVYFSYHSFRINYWGLNVGYSVRLVKDLN